MTNNLSFYIHIPFCINKCDYCAFYSLPNQTDEAKQAYFEALTRQISSFSTEREIDTVYFGGGTPTVLGIDRLCKLLSLIKKRFTLKEGCEITVEVNPKTVNALSLADLKNAGFNRLSIGVQASDDSVLRSIGRIHSFDDAKACIRDARSVGFANISADIIFALPNQSSEAFEKCIYDIMSTNPDHISAYSLQLEEGTPLYTRRDMLDFPDEESEEAQYNSLCEILKSNGYLHYEISSFCKQGFESRHNLNYWARNEYIGFGAAAHSFYNGKRFSNIADVQKYITFSHDGLYAPTDYDDAPFITEPEAEEERIMLNLRTNRGAIIPDSAREAAQKIAKLGYGDFDGKILTLNSRGFRVSNSIISEIVAKGNF